MKINEREQTLVLIKPDALKNSMTGYILSQLSEFHSGMRFAGAKIVHVSRMLAEEHYTEHRGKPFFPALIEYLTGMAHYTDKAWKRRAIALVYQGPDAIKKVREIIGPTNPHIARETHPGSIRSLGTVVPIVDKKGHKISERLDNLIHASASIQEAEWEIKLWFEPNDIPPGMRIFATTVCQDAFYYQDGQVFKEYRPGSVCLVAPGNTAWRTDIDALHAHSAYKKTTVSVQYVAAKYLINEMQDSQ